MKERKGDRQIILIDAPVPISMYDRLNNRGSIRKEIQSIEGSDTGFIKIKDLIPYAKDLLDMSQSKIWPSFSLTVWGQKSHLPVGKGVGRSQAGELIIKPYRILSVAKENLLWISTTPLAQIATTYIGLSPVTLTATWLT